LGCLEAVENVSGKGHWGDLLWTSNDKQGEKIRILIDSKCTDVKSSRKTADSKLRASETQKAVSDMVTVSADAAFICSKKRVDLYQLVVVEDRLVAYGDERWHPETFAAAFTKCILLARQHRAGRDEWARSITDHGTEFGLAAMDALQQYRKTVGLVDKALKVDSKKWHAMHHTLEQTAKVAGEHHLLDGPSVTKELPSAGRGANAGGAAMKNSDLYSGTKRRRGKETPPALCSSSSSCASSSSMDLVAGTSEMPALEAQMEGECEEDEEQKEEEFDAETTEALLNAEITACQAEIKAEAVVRREVLATVRKAEGRPRKRRRTKAEMVEDARRLKPDPDLL